jgi:hypothetical protein
VTRLLLAVLVLIPLAGCRNTSATLELNPTSGWSHSLDDVDSICDQHSNRLYWYGGYNFAVVGQDPTCKVGAR